MSNAIGATSLSTAVKEHFRKRSTKAAFYTLHQGKLVSNTITDIPCAYGFGPTLRSSTITAGVTAINADPTQWTAKDGYWKGDQTSRGLIGNYATEAEWDANFAVRDGAVLVCCQVEEIPNPASSNTVWALGYYGSAGYASHFQLRYNVGHSMQVYAKNDAQVEVANSTLDFDLITPTIVNHFALLDNRSVGKQLMSWWGETIGTRALTAAGTPTAVDPAAFFSCRPILSGGEIDPTRLKFSVGAKYQSRPTEAFNNYALNSVRRVRIFNFGQNLPTNLTEIMQGLNQHNLMDCPELLSL